MAKSPWEKQQEENLIYVATTRAMHHLCHINGVAAVLDKQLNNLQKVLVPTEG